MTNVLWLLDPKTVWCAPSTPQWLQRAPTPIQLRGAVSDQIITVAMFSTSNRPSQSAFLNFHKLPTTPTNKQFDTRDMTHDEEPNKNCGYYQPEFKDCFSELRRTKKTCAKDDFETPMAILVYNPARTFVATTR